MVGKAGKQGRGAKEGKQRERFVSLVPLNFIWHSGPRTDRGLGEDEGGDRKVNGEGKSKKKDMAAGRVRRRNQHIRVSQHQMLIPTT